MRGKNVKRFELIGNPDEDSRVKSEFVEVLRVVCNEFLLKLRQPADLLDLVVNGESEFARLRLAPWNELPRLELASVYLEFLGEKAAAAKSVEKAVSIAVATGVDRFPDRIRASVARASERRRSAGTGGVSGS